MTKIKDMTREELREYKRIKRREYCDRLKALFGTTTPKNRPKRTPRGAASSAAYDGWKPQPTEHEPRKWRGFTPDTIKRLERQQHPVVQMAIPVIRTEFKRIPILERPPYDEYLKARANEILTQHQQPS
jgi:hypothetical protein